jgi:hypothetical protein
MVDMKLIEAGTVERNFILQAVRQFVDRGLITHQRIRNSRQKQAARKIVEGIHSAISGDFDLT